jgi:hypothetical protein
LEVFTLCQGKESIGGKRTSPESCGKKNGLLPIRLEKAERKRPDHKTIEIFGQFYWLPENMKVTLVPVLQSNKSTI